MGALAAASTSSASWLVEDDILLKNAVETGASLESLAKGAVCFSRKFTLQELQDRWNSLLYDPEISTQASARMVEYETELSTSNPAKAHKLFNSKAKDFAFQKRKIDSVKNLYYAMRKRICTEPCNTGELGFLVAPCPCIATGGEGVSGGVLKPSHGHHVAHDIEAGVSTTGCYGQVGESYNGGQPIYPELNRHPFHTKHAENMIKDGDVTNDVPYGYSDVGQIYDQHAYAQKNPETNEKNNMSLKGITGFQDSMQFQQLGCSNQCDNEVAESKTLMSTDQDGVEHGHFPGNSNGRVQEPGSLHLISKTEGSQSPGSKMWNGVEERDTLTLADDKKMKTVNRDHIMWQTGEICTPDLDHAAMSEGDFIDFPFFSNSEDIEFLNGEDFLNSPNQEDVDDPDCKAVLGANSMQNQLHPDETNICYDQVHPGHVKHDAVDLSGIILFPTSSEVPYPGQYAECKLNTEDPEIPCNDDNIIPSESSVQCLTDTSGHNPDHDICSVSPASSPPSNVERSDMGGLAIIKREDMANAQPSSQPIKLSPSTSELNEDSVALNKGCVLGAKLSEGPSTAAAVVHGNIDTVDANICTLALPAFSAAGFGEGSPCNVGHHNSFDKSESLTLHNSVEPPEHMDFSSHNNQPELGDVSTMQNCMPSHALPNFDVQDHVAMAPTSAQAEECSDDEKDVPNFYDLETLILDRELIPWDQDSDLMHPEVSRFQHPESRKSFIRLEQGARSYMNRHILSRGAFAILYGMHLKYFIKDLEVTLGRETEDVKVDIDLGKEGRANKISRRQAIIKMDESGVFHIKNIGKYSIFVNSKEVPCCKRIFLGSDALIEIKDMRFMFHASHDAVRQYVACTLKPEL